MIGNVNDKAENQDNSSAHLNPTATFVINPAVGSTETAHGAVRFLKGIYLILLLKLFHVSI